MLDIKQVKMIDESEFSAFVAYNYNRPYSYQQQDGCKERGVEWFTVPDQAYDFENDSIPEVVNGQIKGVSFEAWLNRDPKKELQNESLDWEIELFWYRNFYPDIQMILNDLHEKGFIEAGDYVLNIDW
jgi:hypothetical protein